MGKWRCKSCGQTKHVLNGVCPTCGPTQTTAIDESAKQESGYYVAEAEKEEHKKVQEAQG